MSIGNFILLHPYSIAVIYFKKLNIVGFRCPIAGKSPAGPNKEEGQFPTNSSL
jgi:hypothetical protein